MPKQTKETKLDTNDKDEDEIIEFNKGKTPKSYTKDKDGKINSKKKDEDTNDNDIIHW